MKVQIGNFFIEYGARNRTHLVSVALGRGDVFPRLSDQLAGLSTKEYPSGVKLVPIHPVIARGKAAFRILWSSARHPGKAIEINKATGYVKVIHD